MKKDLVKGFISIKNNTTSFIICLEDTSCNSLVSIELMPEQFAAMVSGKAYQSCNFRAWQSKIKAAICAESKFEPYKHPVLMQETEKVETIFIPNNATQAQLKALVRPHETDGFKANLNDVMDVRRGIMHEHRRKNGMNMRVRFWRSPV